VSIPNSPDMQRDNENVVVMESCEVALETGREETAAVNSGPHSSTIDSSNGLEEAKLLAAISCGDRTALSNLYEGYYAHLSRFLSPLLGSEKAVEEVINDTFVTIVDKAPAFRSESRLSVWIFRIAHGHASRMPQWYTAREVAQTEVECERPTAGARTQTDLRASLVWSLGQLCTEQRVVLMLCYQMGFSAREIGWVTDSPIVAVRQSMWHARRQLQPYFVASGE
jgi:RNA polymerase sigma factor (sigma-70 family)